MNQETDHRQIARSSFIRKLWIGLGIVAALELIYVLFKFLGSGKKREEPIISDYYEAGPVDNFKVGTITDFSSRKFFLVRISENEFHALSSRCTHLGCSLQCDEKSNKILCPCHSSTFDIRGRVLRSPATRALDRHKVKIENEIVKVNTSSIIRQSDKQS